MANPNSWEPEVQLTDGLQFYTRARASQDQIDEARVVLYKLFDKGFPYVLDEADRQMSADLM